MAMATPMPGRQLLPETPSLQRQPPHPKHKRLSAERRKVIQPWTRHESFQAALAQPALQLHASDRWSAREFMGSGHPYVASRAEYRALGLITDPADERWHGLGAAVETSPPAASGSVAAEGPAPSADLARWHAWNQAPRPALPAGIADYVQRKLPPAAAPVPPGASAVVESSATQAGHLSASLDAEQVQALSAAGEEKQVDADAAPPAPPTAQDLAPAELMAVQADATPRGTGSAEASAPASEQRQQTRRVGSAADDKVRLARVLAASTAGLGEAPTGALNMQEQVACVDLMRSCSLFSFCTRVQLAAVAAQLSRESFQRVLHIITLHQEEEENLADPLLSMPPRGTNPKLLSMPAAASEHPSAVVRSEEAPALLAVAGAGDRDADLLSDEVLGARAVAGSFVDKLIGELLGHSNGNSEGRNGDRGAEKPASAQV